MQNTQNISNSESYINHYDTKFKDYDKLLQ